MMKNNNHWKIDRRIPIALIVTLLLQMASALIWATEQDARVSTIEKHGVGEDILNEKFARLDERLDGVKQQLQLLNHQVDKITDRIIKN